MKITSMSKSKSCKIWRFPVFQACLLSILVFPTTAFAYVDPGSGSVIVTTILGLIAAVGYTFRKYFYKLKNLIRGKKTEEEQHESD